MLVSVNNSSSQNYWDEEYKNIEQQFVTYKQLCDVHELDKNTDKEKFSILPSTGRGVIGRYSLHFHDMENKIPNIIVRETVYKKLCKVDTALKQKNKDCQLVVMYGYRSPEIQKNEFERLYDELKNKYSDPSELNEAVHRIIAVPEVAGHPTGGAVDVTIFDFVKGKYWEFGTEVHDFSEKKKVYYDSPEIKRKQPKSFDNRNTLRRLMGKQDFVPYDGEWWHFSYGDKEWAFYKYRENIRKEGLIGELKYKYAQKSISEIQYVEKYKQTEINVENCIRLAIQKEGRLTDETLTMLQRAGIEIKTDKRQFVVKSLNYALEILFVRDDDIPNLVNTGVADIGIVGENVLYETIFFGTEKHNIEILRPLGFGQCSLALAVPKDSEIQKPTDLIGKIIATSYRNITINFLKSIDIDILKYNINIRDLSGSVEIAPSIGYADAIVDLVSTGVSLQQNNLRHVLKIMDSESVLIKNKNINQNKIDLIKDFLARIDSYRNAQKYKYIIMNVPIVFLNEFKKILLDELKEIISEFDSSILDDKRMISLFLDDESSLETEIENIISSVNNSVAISDEQVNNVRQVIIDISNRHFQSSPENRQVHVLVNKDSLWEEKVKRMGATDIIILDVERFIPK